jgi:hypothetical protein
MGQNTAGQFGSAGNLKMKAIDSAVRPPVSDNPTKVKNRQSVKIFSVRRFQEIFAGAGLPTRRRGWG